ncbi:MAG: phosphotransferase family protein [Thalassobaculaceae bacterium]|nr:phosphotransferase family protein [Thalassobaculaceae bacterium]
MFESRPLAAHLAAQGMTLDSDVPARRFAGGLANLNYRISVDGRPAVLRRAPSGPLPPGAHDMAREHRVLHALSPAFPLAPDSLVLCADPEVLGAPFQILEYRDGRTVRGDDLSVLAPGEDLRGALCDLLARPLADLHAVDPAACGLDDLGRPEGFVPRNAARWSARAKELAEGRSEAALAAEIAGWLERKLSGWDRGAVSLLHCDFKLDNMILAPDRLAPVGIVDWDMATRGEPLFDLATLLSYWSEPGDPECLRGLGQMPTALAGFPGRREMAEAYAKASGRSLDGLEEIYVLCLFKLSVIFLQLHARWKSGAIGDDRYARFETLGFDLMTHTWDVARGAAD